MSVTIFGYGSIMNTKSAMRSMPSAINFRRGILFEYSRSFNLVSISGIRSGMAKVATNEVAALSIGPDVNHRVCGVLFEIPPDELHSYLEREHRYMAAQLQIVDYDRNCFVVAWTVVEQTDQEYRNSLKGGDEEWERRVGQFYNDRLWGRQDVLPMPEYTINALVAAFDLGGFEWLDNILDHTFLADASSTPLREYLRNCLENSEDKNAVLSQHIDGIILHESLLLHVYITR